MQNCIHRAVCRAESFIKPANSGALKLSTAHMSRSCICVLQQKSWCSCTHPGQPTCTPLQTHLLDGEWPITQNVQEEKREKDRQAVEARKKREEVAAARLARVQVQQENAQMANQMENDLARIEKENQSNEEKEREEKLAIETKYKRYPFMKFKKFLVSNGIPKADVDKCLNKYQMTMLAVQHEVEIPDDPKDL